MNENENERPTTVETAFDMDGRTYYTDLPPDELPSVGDEVRMTGDECAPVGKFVVTEVSRTYDLDKGRLTFVNVSMKKAER